MLQKHEYTNTPLKFNSSPFAKVMVGRTIQLPFGFRPHFSGPNCEKLRKGIWHMHLWNLWMPRFYPGPGVNWFIYMFSHFFLVPSLWWSNKVSQIKSNNQRSWLFWWNLCPSSNSPNWSFSQKWGDLALSFCNIWTWGCLNSQIFFQLKGRCCFHIYFSHQTNLLKETSITQTNSNLTTLSWKSSASPCFPPKGS